MDLPGHVPVQGQQNLVVQLNQGGVDPGVDQVLRHLQADEAAPHHYGGAGLFPLQEVPDAEGVLHGPQGEDALQVDAGQGRTDGPGPGGEDQLVIGFSVLAAVLQSPDCDGVFFRLDGQCLIPDPHVNPKTGLEALWSLERQGLLVPNGPSNVVGQAAVGIRDIP